MKQLPITYPYATIYEINRKKTNSSNNCIELDLLNINLNKIEEIFKLHKPYLFFHLAWCTNHSNYLITEENILWEKLTINLINAFYNSGGYKFIGVGSSIEYDWTNPSPYNELKSKLNGNSTLYGNSKLAIFKYLSSIPNINFQWDRIFFVFGPGQSKGRLIPLIINNALYNSDELKINLNLARDYISTFEVSKQILMMSTTKYCGSLNICSGRSILLSELVSYIEILTNKTISIISNNFKDNFDIPNIFGTQDIIKTYFSDYEYSDDDFVNDLKNTINLFYE